MATQQYIPIVTSSPIFEAREWFAIQTRARHEKKVAAQLTEKGMTSFLPLVSSLQRWSDRRKVVEFPLFACYTFVQADWSAVARSAILRTPGVFRIVGAGEQPIPIPDPQIESIRLLLEKRIACSPHPFLNVGQRVRVRGGCLDGVEGILLAFKSNRTLVISVEPIQRSVAIQVGGDYEVEDI